MLITECSIRTALELLKDSLQQGRVIVFEVDSDSMLPCFRKGDRLKVAFCSVESLMAGDVIVYEKGDQWIVHRLIKKYTYEGQIFLRTKGDAKDCCDASFAASQYFVGKVISWHYRQRWCSFEGGILRRWRYVLANLSYLTFCIPGYIYKFRKRCFGVGHIPGGKRIGQIVQRVVTAVLYSCMHVMFFSWKITLCFKKDEHVDLSSRAVKALANEDKNALVDLFRHDENGITCAVSFFFDNHLSGLLYVTGLQLGLRAGLPRTVWDRLKMAYARQWSRNELLLMEATDLLACFQDAGCDIIFLKGPFLSKRVYGDIDRREIWDLDILVHEKDIEKAGRILHKRGYKGWLPALAHWPWVRRFTHHLEYQKEGVYLDLHWSLDTHGSYQIPYQKVWLQRTVQLIGKTRYPVLSDEYLLVHLLVSAFKDIQLGVLRYRWVIDVYRLLKVIDPDFSWEAFFISRKKEGLLWITMDMLRLLLDFLDAASEFGSLARCLSEDLPGHRLTHSDDCYFLFERTPWTWRHKFWAVSRYAMPAYKVFGWWCSSLPFRMLMHDHRDRIYKDAQGRLG